MTTAVEWLIDEHFGGIENCTPDFRFHIQQAKEMEKEQKIEFAKLHVEAALKAAQESTLEYDFTEEITNSYPLENIK
jgi:hypothetical protein